MTLVAVMMSLWSGYDGPLSDRQVHLDNPPAGSIFFFEAVGPEADRIRMIANYLQRKPLYVLAPGNKYAGYGLIGDGGDVHVLIFNRLVMAAADRFLKSGLYPKGEDHLTLVVSDSIEGIAPNPGDAVKWALTALHSMGVRDIGWSESISGRWDPSIDDLIRDWQTNRKHYDRAMVRKILRKWGIEPPDDL